jgi:putative tryptophan/tyrosine transport system substrate-binding protein
LNSEPPRVRDWPGSVARRAPRPRGTAARTVRIGWLLPAAKAFALDAFRQRLKELGWIESSNLVIEERYSHGTGNRYVPLAAELVRLKVDALVTDGSAATTAAQRATQTIPIVFVSGNPVGAGFAASLSHPGKNLTGVSIITGDVTPKRVQLLKEAATSMMRLTMLEDLTAAGLARSDARLPENWRAIEVASRELGVQLLPTIEVRQPEELDSAFALAVRGRADGVLVLASPFFSAESRRIVSLASNARLPAIYEHRGFAEAGGLTSYGAYHRAIFLLVAYYVDKILKGAKPADLPVEQPTKFELVINLKTAKALGLTVPPSLLLRADQGIE